MQSERRAIIDIGTNSVKLLVGDISQGRIAPVLETSNQTRLGHGFYETHVMQPEAIRQTALAVADFVAEARRMGATSVCAIATSAVREATNQGALVRAVTDAAGLPLRIITGDEEADYAYRGVLTDHSYGGTPLLLLDMGGGSTEFVLGVNGQSCFKHSFRLGTLRLMDSLKISDPPKPTELDACMRRVSEYLKAEVRPALSPHLEKARQSHGEGGVHLVGTGGTAGIIVRIEAGLPNYDRMAMEKVVVSLDSMRHHTKKLWRLPLEQRKEIVGLPAHRADVILTGVAAYTVIMEEFGFSAFRASTRGLRFAVLLEECLESRMDTSSWTECRRSSASHAASSPPL